MRLLVIKGNWKFSKIYDIFQTCILLTILGLSWSCQNLQSETTRYADFFVRFSEDDQICAAQAVFSEGDSISGFKSLAFLGGVNFQGKNMVLFPTKKNGYRYEYKADCYFSSPVTFHFIDEQGINQEFSVEFETFSQFSVKDNKVSKFSGLELITNEPKSLINTSIVLLILDGSNQSTFLTPEAASLSNNMVLSSDALENLTPSNGQVIVIYKFRKKERNENWISSFALEYYTQSIPVVITE